jgi:pimeloyl-ACP methyl ester carboxylesterase
MTTVEANGVTLGIAHFGDVAAPLVLCAGGTTMLSWPDALCESLARGGRHVVRYDLRDSGASITVDPEAPAYTLRDLAADAAALARELDDRPAHLAGIGVGGMVAQVAALDHPEAFSALTLAGTRPVAPGPVDDDLAGASRPARWYTWSTNIMASLSNSDLAHPPRSNPPRGGTGKL